MKVKRQAYTLIEVMLAVMFISLLVASFTILMNRGMRLALDMGERRLGDDALQRAAPWLREATRGSDPSDWTLTADGASFGENRGVTKKDHRLDVDLPDGGRAVLAPPGTRWTLVRDGEACVVLMLLNEEDDTLGRIVACGN